MGQCFVLGDPKGHRDRTSKKQEKKQLLKAKAAFSPCNFPQSQPQQFLGSEERLEQPPAIPGSRNCLLSTDLTLPHQRLQLMDHFILFLVSFTLAKRKPRNCRKYSFIPHKRRIREWDEEQQLQPCRVADFAVSSPDPDFKHQPNFQGRNCSSSQRRGGIAMQKKPALFLLNEAAENQLSTTQIFSGKTSLQRKNNPYSPLESCIQCCLWHPDKPVHKTDEHTPFSKEGTKRNQDNPSREEIHAAIKALIKY